MALKVQAGVALTPRANVTAACFVQIDSQAEGTSRPATGKANGSEVHSTSRDHIEMQCVSQDIPRS